MSVRINWLVAAIMLSVASIGCSKEEVGKTYDVSDVEQLLIDHPELSAPPPAEYAE